MFRKIALTAFVSATLSAPAAAVTILLGHGNPLDFVTGTIVPEPQSLALLMAGFGMVGLSARRRPAAEL